jgi:hypothetical protein
MLYLIARLAHAVSTGRFFSWFTRITFGENLLVTSLITVSRDCSVFYVIILTLPGNPLKYVLKDSYLALIFALSALIFSNASSGNSSISFFFKYLCFIVL